MTTFLSKSFFALKNPVPLHFPQNPSLGSSSFVVVKVCCLLLLKVCYIKYAGTLESKLWSGSQRDALVQCCTGKQSLSGGREKAWIFLPVQAVISHMKEMHRRDVYDTLQLLKIWSLTSKQQLNPTEIEKQWEFFFSSCICTVTTRILLHFWLHELQLLSMSTGHFVELLVMDALLAGAIVKLCLGLRISVSLEKKLGQHVQTSQNYWHLVIFHKYVINFKEVKVICDFSNSFFFPFRKIMCWIYHTYTEIIHVSMSFLS